MEAAAAGVCASTPHFKAPAPLLLVGPMACVLVLFNVGKPWSEDTPGLDFSQWWVGRFRLGLAWHLDLGRP
jgi:hypothetical protein